MEDILFLIKQFSASKQYFQGVENFKHIPVKHFKHIHAYCRKENRTFHFSDKIL